MGFDIKQLTQDMEQNLFTITTHYPILLAQYHDCYSWGKFGHSLLPPMILLNARQNLQLRSTYCNTLQQLLCIDLDGNLSTPMNPPTEAKLKEYVSILFRGMFNTTTQGKIFDKHMKKSESRQLIIKKVREIALSAMIFPLSIFTFYSTWGFQSMIFWNQHMSCCSRSISRWRQNPVVSAFFLEIYPCTL